MIANGSEAAVPTVHNLFQQFLASVMDVPPSDALRLARDFNTFCQAHGMIGATGEFPEDKIDPTDQGELQFRVGLDANQCVRVEFGAPPVAWFALRRQEAILLAMALAKLARRLPA